MGFEKKHSDIHYIDRGGQRLLGRDVVNDFW